MLAERGLAHAFLLDSAGTGAWHVNSPPDPRSVAIARSHGIDISGQRARKVVAADFTRFDLLLGMDQSNVDDLHAMAPSGTAQKIHRFLDFAGGPAGDVPDPYYGGPQGFGDVYRMIRVASEALLLKLEARDSAMPSGQASSIT